MFRFEGFLDYSVPEILRVPLEELCLHIMVIPKDRTRGLLLVGVLVLVGGGGGGSHSLLGKI